MGALTKADMAESLYDEVGLNKREAKEMVEAFFDEIVGALGHNEQVKLSGFGNFDLRDKKQRPGRNPKTGEFQATSHTLLERPVGSYKTMSDVSAVDVVVSIELLDLKDGSFLSSSTKDQDVSATNSSDKLSRGYFLMVGDVVVKSKNTVTG